jgi:xanthine/uracil permease
MQLKYKLEETPPAGELVLFGLQWFAIAIPTIIIIGKISSGLHFTTPEDEIVYLQKLTFCMGAAMLAQLLAGHRLPLIIGPSTVLLIGTITSRHAGVDAVYSSILIGGVLLTLVSLTDFFAALKRFFTPRVVAAVLLLIAFTLAPTVLNLIAPVRSKAGPVSSLLFSLVLIFMMFSLYARLKGIWKSTLIIWSMAAGSILYFLLFQSDFDFGQVERVPLMAGFFHHLTTRIEIDPGVLIAFVFCFMALSINDLGSIQAVNELLKSEDQKQRISRGILVTGLANILSGFLGVIGPVNYSLSPGVIASTGCASRRSLLPAAILLCVLPFFPPVLALINMVPSAVIGCVLLFLLCFQVSAGLVLFLESSRGDLFEGGLIVGLSILLGAIVAFLPTAVLDALPGIFRPILGNGFVVGVSATLILEHVIFKKDLKRDAPAD